MAMVDLNRADRRHVFPRHHPAGDARDRGRDQAFGCALAEDLGD